MNKLLTKLITNINDYVKYWAISCILLVCCNIILVDVIQKNVSNILPHYEKLIHYKNNYEDAMCIYHNGSIIDNKTLTIQNMMVITNKDGIIVTNITLNCLSDYIDSQVNKSIDYCGALIHDENKDIVVENIVESSSILDSIFSYVRLSKKKVMSPQMNRYIECKINKTEVSSNVIHNINFETFIINAVNNINTTNNFSIILIYVNIICFIVSIILVYFKYNLRKLKNYYVMHYYDQNPHTNIRITGDPMCIFSYDEIKYGDVYFQCTRCMSVYDYYIYSEWWKSSRKCGYCMLSIHKLVKYVNK